MINLFKYNFRIFLRNRDQLIWNTLFPFVYMLIYVMAMHNLAAGELEITTLKLAILPQKTEAAVQDQDKPGIPSSLALQDFFAYMQDEAVEAELTDQGLVAPDQEVTDQTLIIYREASSYEEAEQWLKDGWVYAMVQEVPGQSPNVEVISLYFKILRYNKVGILSYLLVFLLLFLLISSSVKQDLPSSLLQTIEPTIQVNDHDQTELSQHLKAYLLRDAQSPETEVPEDTEKIKEALYDGAIDYLLVIPEGFTDSLQEEREYLDLFSYPSSFGGVATSIEMKIISYVQNWERIALTFGGNPQGTDLTRALKLLDEVLAVDVEIYTHAGRTTEVENEQLTGLAYYLSFLTYIISAVGFLWKLPRLCSCPASSTCWLWFPWLSSSATSFRQIPP